MNDSINSVVQSAAMGFITNPGLPGHDHLLRPLRRGDHDADRRRHLAGGDHGYQYTPLGAILKSGAPVSISVQASDVLEQCPLAGCPTAVNPAPPTCPNT